MSKNRFYSGDFAQFKKHLEPDEYMGNVGIVVDSRELYTVLTPEGYKNFECLHPIQAELKPIIHAIINGFQIE